MTSLTSGSDVAASGLLKGTVVLITGGSGTQGLAHAVASAREGADVALVDVTDPETSAPLKQAADDIRALGRRVVAVRADVTSQAELDAGVAQVIDELGSIDSVIINAGIYRSGSFWETTDEAWDRVMSINLTGAWRTAKAVMPHMMARESGSIIFISSVDGIDPEVESTAYGVSKTGVLGLMKYVALEAARYSIRCNAIAPGLIDTPMVSNQAFYDLLAGDGTPGTRAHLVEHGRRYTALKGTSVLAASNVANAAVYLNSALAANVTGVVLPVDAGHLLLARANTNPA